MIRLNAILLPDRRRVAINPTAVLRCAMAESFAAWIRDEASNHAAELGDTLRSVDTYGSYECRGRNGIADAKLSEHGKGNAIDVRALVMAGGRHIELTNETVSKSLRDDMRDSACHRFTTVLGPGADSYHNNHIHLDILNGTGEPAFASGMCVNRLLRRLKSRVAERGSPRGPHSPNLGRQTTRQSARAPGQSDRPTRQINCKAAR